MKVKRIRYLVHRQDELNILLADFLKCGLIRDTKHTKDVRKKIKRFIRYYIFKELMNTVRELDKLSKS